MNSSSKSTEEIPASKERGIRIIMTGSAELVPYLLPILQKGFTVETTIGCSIRTLLCQHLGMKEEYLEERIQTLFLDGNPVDDMDGAIVRDGSVLALSAAMPGLLGAILRKGGHYASMRSQISYREDARPVSPRKGRVVIKLFNLLIRELGVHFVKRGITINGEDLLKLFRKHGEEIREKLMAISINGQKSDFEKLSLMEWGSGEVFLTVRIVEN